METDNGEIVGYTTPLGCPYTLDKVSGLYQMSDESGIVYKFNSILKLQSVIDQPYLMETSEDINETTKRLKEVSLYDHAGNLDWTFIAVYDTNGALTGLTLASGCPFTLALVNNEYVLTEVQNSSMTYSFETNATDNHDQLLAMTTTVQSSSIITPSSLTFSYNTSHQLTGVSDGDNHSISVVYGSGYIQVTDLDGRKVIYNIANNQLNSVQRLESNENNNPVYATTLYTYDANGFLNSICDPDNVSDLLTFGSQGKLTSHANRYSQQTDAQNTVFTWWQYTFLEYATGTTTVRNQMRQYQRAASATEDTLLQTVRLSKSLYAIDTTEKLITSIALYPQPTLISGEDGQDESDYNYGANPIKTITLTYSDEDTDGFYDLITQSTSDNDSTTPNLSEESSVYTSATAFFPAYVSGEEETDTTIYDLAGRVSAICPDIENHGTTGHVCDQYTYSPAGRVLTELTRTGLETSYTYDSSGRVCKTEHPDGHESTNGFDYISNPQSPFTEDYFLELETDYGLNYYLERHLNTLGQTVYEEIRNCGDWLNLIYTYNGLGQKASQTDKNGNVTSYTYYASGQVHEETVDQATGPDLLTHYTYTEDDLIETETDPYNNVSAYVYDSENGNRLSSKSTIANGKLTKEVYDYSTLEISHYYTLTTTSYDGSTDTAAILTSTVTQLNEDDQTTSVSKAVSNLVGGSAIANTYLYDEDDQLWKIEHNGFYYVFGRDEDGTITSISVSTLDGSSSLVLLEKTHTENTDGSTTDTDSYANGQDVSVITDKFGRTEKIQYNDGTTIVDRYVYVYGSEDTTENDVDGQEITTVDDNSSGRKTVSSKSDDADSFNQEIVVTDLNTLVQLYSCSIVNSETAVTLTTLVGATEQSYTYNKDTSGRLYQSAYDLADSTAVLKTDSFGDYSELTGFVLNINSIARLQKSLIYRSISGVNFSGQVASETIQQSGTAASYGYEYDGLDNITKITKTVGGTTTDLYHYKYDVASQLVREDNCVTNQTTTWQYDVGGNIRFKRIYALTAFDTTPTNPIDEIPYVYSTGIWKDLLTSYDGQSITYDASGNPNSYLGATMTWTMGRQLASYDKGSLSIDYTYNENGIRTSKTVNNVRTDYYLSGSQVIAEVTGGNRIDYRYDGNGKLIALRYNSNEYYYVTNIQGDTIGLIDGSGTSVVQYTYDAWGNQTSCTGTLANTLGQANPYRYRGYRFDSETGLYYLQSRYYDAEVGRFINADDLSILKANNKNILDSNLYLYCVNNPQRFFDPYGTTVFALGVEGLVASVFGPYLAVGLAVDLHGNVAIVVTVGAVVITNVCASIAGYLAIYYGLDSVFSLRGWGISVGVDWSMGFKARVSAGLYFSFSGETSFYTSISFGIGVQMIQVPSFIVIIGHSFLPVTFNLRTALTTWRDYYTRRYTFEGYPILLRKVRDHVDLIILPLNRTIRIYSFSRMRII